jgi:hypothetical protein
LYIGSSDLEAFKSRWTSVLLRRPILALDDGLYMIPSRTFLENTIGAGLYFRLQDCVVNHQELRALRQLFGAFFEQNVFELLLNISTEIGWRLHRAERYETAMGERESTDIVIIDNRDVVFLEVVGTFVPLDTIASLDKSRVDDLFRKFVLKKRPGSFTIESKTIVLDCGRLVSPPPTRIASFRSLSYRRIFRDRSMFSSESMTLSNETVGSRAPRA